MAVLRSLKNLLFNESFSIKTMLNESADYEIRPLLSDQLNELVKLNLRCFRNGENYTRQTFKFLFNEPNTLAYKAATNDRMIGYLFAIVQQEGLAHITTLGVDPEFRRRGIASKLLIHLENRLRAKNINTIALEVRLSNHSARRLYLRHGFAVTQRISNYYSDGEDCLLMIKAINS
jgi:ribosomal-protein-alanine N-acetyltransferase